MIEYVGQINLANENFGQTEKTITANEVVRTADTKALAEVMRVKDGSNSVLFVPCVIYRADG